MLENTTKPLKLALYGMDSRAVKVMMKFLHGSCKGAAIVVNSADDIDIYDADVPVSKNLLDKCLQECLLKPLIVLSAQDFMREGVLYVKKPIETNDMLMVLDQAKILAAEFAMKADESGMPLALKPASWMPCKMGNNAPGLSLRLVMIACPLACTLGFMGLDPVIRFSLRQCRYS